jgi:peptidoglycan/xylan/chitin deacetylase (PgdA/CDA1 family)
MMRLGNGATLRVLLYHRLEAPPAPRADLAPDLVSASPARFQQQLRHLARFYHPIGADELLRALAGRHVLPRRAVLVTFDDGYRDFLEVAWPILKRYRIPAVLFVPTAFVDEPGRVFWWDALWQMLARTRRDCVTLPGRPVLPLASRDDRVAASRTVAEWLKTLTPSARAAALEQLAAQLGVRPEPTRAVLSWPELRGLAHDGVTVAAHSRTHELLDQLAGPDLTREVAGCRDDLIRELGSCPPLFAYPNGNCDGRTLDALDAAEFRAGFTVTRGFDRLRGADLLLLRRNEERVTLLRFALNLLEPVAAVRAARHGPGPTSPARRPAGRRPPPARLPP